MDKWLQQFADKKNDLVVDNVKMRKSFIYVCIIQGNKITIPIESDQVTQICLCKED